MKKKIKSGWSIILTIFSEVFKISDDDNLQSQIIEILENLGVNNYGVISDIYEQYSACIILYVDKFPEKVSSIFESNILSVENEKNLKILINNFMNLLLNNNQNIRTKNLENFSKCIDNKIKLNNSNMNELGKNPNFWKYMINQVLLKTITEMIKKIILLNFLINNKNISFVSINNSQTPDSTNDLNLSNENINDSNNNNIINNNKSINEKEEFCTTLQNFLIVIVNLFNTFFAYNYKELTTFFESVEKIILSDDEYIQKVGLGCVKYLNECEKMKNQYFLQTFSLFLKNLVNNSLEEGFNNINENELYNCIKNKNNHKLIDKNLSLAFIHSHILDLLDKLLSQNIYFLSEEVLNELLVCLEDSINISNNLNSNIQLRFLINDYTKITRNDSTPDEEIFNLFKQFQIAYKNFFFISEFLFFKDNGISNKQNYYKKIIDMSIKAINVYNNKNKDFLNLLNKTNNEKEVKEKEAELNNYVICLCDYIFPSIQKIEFYKNDKDRDIICNLFFDLILCYDQRIREKVRDILNIAFDTIYKNIK